MNGDLPLFSYLPFVTFLLASLPLVWTDLKSYTLSAAHTVIATFIVVVTALFFSQEDLFVQISIAGVILLSGGLLWRLSNQRFGLGDVIYLALMALVLNPINLYFTVLTACLAGFGFYGYHLLKFRRVTGVPLAFIPVLFLSTLLIEVSRWFVNPSF